MNQNLRILLTAFERVRVDPPDDRIDVCDSPAAKHLPTTAQLSQYTHLAHGRVGGRVSSLALLQGAAAAGATRVLLPLEGYDLPELADTVMAILPARILRGMVAIHSVPRPGASPDLTRDGSSLQLIMPAERVGRPTEPFVLPKLRPDPSSSDPTVFPETFDRTPAYVAQLAGMAQIDDELDTSHHLAQSIEGHPDGDYWHAIMHRREPDYGNAKYWYRHVGRHPVFAQLASRAGEILSEAADDVRSRWGSRLKVDAGWDPFAFVDMCEAAADDEDNDLGLTARRIQWSEMLLLLRQCSRSG